MKKEFLFIYFICFNFLFLNSCYLIQESTNLKNKIIINPEIRHETDRAFTKIKCFPIAISETGFCEITDTSDAELFLMPN